MKRALWWLRVLSALALTLTGGLLWLLAWWITPEDVHAADRSSAPPPPPLPNLNRPTFYQEHANGRPGQIH